MRNRLFVFLLILVMGISSAAFADGLKVGSKGASVSSLQNQLKKMGYFSGQATGYYGTQTQAAVKKFQKQQGVIADGIVGSVTSKKLAAAASKTVSRSSSTARSVSTASADDSLQDANILLENDNNASETDGTSSTESIAVEKVKTEDKAEVLDWFKDAQDVFYRGATAEVLDVWSGKTFSIMRTYGSNHADCETLTKEDTSIMKEIWGGTWSWSRRPVIIKIDGRELAASMAGMPHAGIDSKKANITVSGRSGGYGTGDNLDTVKNNGMDGHFDVHFLNSKTHGSNKVDPAHQKAIKEAANATP